MATVDSLDIQISAEASKANKAIGILSQNLTTLSKNLGRLNGNSLSNFSSAMQNLSVGIKNLQGIKAKDFTPIASGIKKFENLNSGKISSVGGSLKTLASGLNTISGISFNTESLNGISSVLNKLGSVKGTAGADNLLKIKNSLSQFVRGLNDIGSVTFDTASLSNLIFSISRLGNTGANNATKNLPTISAQLQNFVRQLNQIGSLSFDTANLSNLITSISRLGYKGVSNAITNLPLLTRELNNLMTTLSRAPRVSNNVIQMTNALANLASQGGRVGTASRTLANGLNNSTNAMNRATKSSMSLASAFGKFYATWFLVIRGIKKLWASIESSMDYVEVLNYFNAAFDQVAQKADLSNFRQLGYDSAEEYAKSFSERAKQLTAQMTGFEVTDKGTLEATGMPSLGINPSQLMQYQAMFGQMASSMGVASETSLKLSRALTEIGADLASVKNMDFGKVWTDMASGLAGMSRTLDKYGVNIRNVNLQQKLTELGINANITALNQNDKALLRTIILLDSTRYAWGDMADTINQPANQLRLINANFQNLGRTIGNLFLPLVQKVLPYINALVIALQRLFTWIGSLLGIDLSGITSVGDTDFSGIIGETDDLTGGLNDAAKAAQKLKTITLGIDELNINAPQEDDDAGTGGAGGLSSGLLDAAFEDALSKYQQAWDEAFANMENRTNMFADSIANAFKKGGLYEVGKYFSDELTKALNSINWDSIYSGAASFGVGLANFLNGLITPDLFGTVGMTIASSLNTALYALNSFGTTFDWKDFGLSIATGINNFFSTFDFTLLADTINTWVKGALTTVTTLLKETDFEQIGNKIGEFLKELDFLEIAGDLADAIWEAIKAGFDLIEGLFDEAPLEASLITAFSLFKFTNLGTFVSKKIAKAIASKLGIEIAKDAGIGTAISTGLTTAWTSLGGLGGILTTDLATIVGAGTLTEIGLTIGTGIIGGIAAAFTGWSIGQLLYEETSGEEVDMDFSEQFSYLLDAFKTGELGEAVKQWWGDDVESFYQDKADSIAQTFDDWKSDVETNFDLMGTYISDTFTTISDKVSVWWEEDVAPWFTLDKWSELFNNIWTSLQNKWSEIKTWWQESALVVWWEEDVAPWFTLDKWSELYQSIKDSLITKVKEAITGWKTNIEKWWKDNVEPWFTLEKWTGMMSGVIDGFKQTFKNAANAAIEIFNNLIDWINEKMHFEWDAIEIMGQQIIPAGNVQLFTIPKIPKFETGGFPEDGLFYANHNELVGEFSNGRTAVANNEMIVAGIEEAAYRGMTRALQESGNASLLADIADNTRAAVDREIVARIDPTRETVSALRNAESRYGFQFT